MRLADHGSFILFYNKGIAMSKDYSITLKEINDAILDCHKGITSFTKAVEESLYDIEDSFSNLSKSIEVYKKKIQAYREQDVPVIEPMDKDTPSSYPGKENFDAKINSILNRACKTKAREAIYLIRDSVLCKDKEIKIKHLESLIYSLKYSLPFKIYVLSTIDSYIPYSVGKLLNWRIKKWQKKFANKNLKKDNWKYIGYAQDLKEVYHYVENNGFSWGGKIHLCTDPDDECTNNFVKMEGEYFTEYFDSYAKGPFGHLFNFRKRETVCLFCCKKFYYEGCSCKPVINRFNELYFQYAKCCKSCYRKYVKPAKKNEQFAQKIQSDFKLYL